MADVRHRAEPAGADKPREELAFVVDQLAKVLTDGKGVFSTRETPTTGLTPGQVAVGPDRQALIAPADTTRRSLLVRNVGPATVYLGGRDVDDTTGFPLDAGEALSFTTVSALYGQTAAGNADVRTLGETGTAR